MRLQLRCAAAIAALVVGVASTSAADPSSPSSRYVDHAFGFSFDAPEFSPSASPDIATVAISLAESPVDGFAASVNVVVHNMNTTLTDYRSRQSAELGVLGWTVLDQSVTHLRGQPTLRTRARGRLNTHSLEFLSVTLIGDDGRVYVLTCTAPQARFAALESEFERVTASFTLPVATRADALPLSQPSLEQDASSWLARGEDR